MRGHIVEALGTIAAYILYWGVLWLWIQGTDLTTLGVI